METSLTYDDAAHRDEKKENQTRIIAASQIFTHLNSFVQMPGNPSKPV